jgi:hypothetical protein
MRKLAPIVLALGLTARALFGNPLESTLIKDDTKKEFDITGSVDNKSLSLDVSLPRGDDWNVSLASDMEFIDTPKIKNVDLVLGRENFYLGASFENLSTETLLQDSNIFKIQWGIKPADWIDFSVTGALMNIPNMTIYYSSLGLGNLQTPLTLYAGGLNINLGKKFDLKSSSLFPWLSITASGYIADPKNTSDFQTANANFPGYDSILLAAPFDHIHIEGGLDFGTKYLDLSYKGSLEGFPLPDSLGSYSMPYNFTNMVGITMHDEDKKKLNLEYNLGLITKPQYHFDKILSPTRNELQFDINGFYIFDNGIYLKGKFSTLVDFLTPNQFNITAAIGKEFKEGNLELYYSLQNDAYGSQNNVFGLQYSTQLDKSTEKENRTRNNFHNSTVSEPVITNNSGYSLDSDPHSNLVPLHSRFGNTLEEAVSNVHSEQDLSNLASYFVWKDHDGTFTAKEEYEIYGYGTCRDTNGNLLTYIEEKAFDYKNVYAVAIRGPFVSHVITIIEKQNSKFDLRQYSDYYEIDAPTAQAAIDKIFPGAYIFDDGTVSTAVSTIRNAVENPLYDWTKFK